MEVNLLTLTKIIKKNLSTDKYILKAEISGVSIKNNNMYLNLKDNTVKISAMIWSCKKVLNNTELNDGDKIKVKGYLNYYAPYGNLNFIITEFIEKDGEGEIYKKFINNKINFVKKGYFDENKKKILTNLINTVTILTSKEGDALQDFMKNIKRENSKIKVNIVNVAVQGKNCPNDIIEFLKMENEISTNTKIIVITRGGGNFEDLNGFNHPELIEHVFQSKHIILSAIGHQRDNTLLDMVADYSKPTPSLVSQFLISHNNNIIEAYYKKIRSSINIVTNKLNDEFLYLERLERFLDKEENTFEEFIKEKQNDLFNQINEEIHQLSLFESDLGKVTEIAVVSNDIKIDSLEKIKLLFDNNKFNLIIGGHTFVIDNYHIKEKY